jgi:anti-sigma regulatory factor (Ser/Thr protein kinase)
LVSQEYDRAVTLWRQNPSASNKTPWESLVTHTPAAVSGLEYRLILTAHALTVRISRKLAEIALDNWDLGYLKDKAAIILSELATNAARIAPGTEIEVGVGWHDGWVRLEVWDESPEIPSVPTAPSLESEDGRGLWLSSHLADKFGIDPRSGGGKTIWAMLQCDPAPSS